jgi:haloalkane dehalogenase
MSQAFIAATDPYTDPGTILTGGQREFCRRWPNQHEGHFIQEDSPGDIGHAIAAFVRRNCS